VDFAGVRFRLKGEINLFNVELTIGEIPRDSLDLARIALLDQNLVTESLPYDLERTLLFFPLQTTVKLSLWSLS
jgi:hypothetical protein